MKQSNEDIYWKKYWADKTTGEHRSQSEDFLQREAQEKLLHLAPGGKLLDFGCGSADLLSFYASHYDLTVGSDRSASMLAKAKENLAQAGVSEKVSLIEADDKQIWNNLQSRYGADIRFDCITAGQVIQYFDAQQAEEFIANAGKHLATDGRICLFDVVDSRTYELWEAGLFNQDRISFYTICKLIKIRLRAKANLFRGKPKHNLGSIYPPQLFSDIAAKHGLNIYFAHSMYYEYRYHVILSR